MLLFFTLFFILFGFWIVLFLFNSYFSLVMILIGFVASVLITTVCIKLRLFSPKTGFLFLQVGFYKIILNKFITCMSETTYLAFEFFKKENYVDPVLDYLFIENEDIYENNLSSSILSLNAGIISSMIKNRCIIIHSMNKLFFTPNQLYFLSIETQKVNDDSLV